MTKIKYFFILLLLSVAYLSAAKIGLLLATINNTASPVWPATGLAFAILLRYGFRYWPAIALGAFVANLLTGLPVLAVVMISMGNTLEALVGVFVIRRILLHDEKLEGQSEVIAFFLGSIFGASLSAGIGALSLYFVNSANYENLGQIWYTWFIGDFIGGLIIGPFLYFLRDFKKIQLMNRLSIAKALIFFMFLVLSIYLVFVMDEGAGLVFVLFPFLLLSEFFLVSAFTRLTIIILSVVAISFSLNGIGPFIRGGLNENLIHLELFLAAIAITGLVLIGFKKVNRLQLASFVLLVGWLLSGGLFFSFYMNEVKDDRGRLDEIAQEIQNKVENRMQSYIDTLLGGAGLYEASTDVSLEEWRAYLSALKIEQRYPGIRGIGVVWPVPSHEVQIFQQKVKKLGVKDFELQLVPNLFSKDEIRKKFGNHYVITFIEPLSRNQRAVGLDIGSELNRRSAAELAMKSGEATITEKITLVQDDKHRISFLILYPMYKKNTNIETTEMRVKNHTGWIYAPFVAEELFSGVLSKFDSQMDIDVYDSEIKPTNLVYSTRGSSIKKSQYKKISEIKIAQRVFKMGWDVKPAFYGKHTSASAWVGFSGAIACLLLAAIVVILESVGIKARKIADEKTSLLRSRESEILEQKEKLEEALKTAVAATKAKSDFLANMSHEIRTPLNGIMGVSRMFDLSGMNDEQKENLSIISRSGESLLNIINDILDFSKIEAGKIDIEKIAFDPRIVIEDLKRTMEFSARNKGLEISVNVSENVPEFIKGDPGRLGQVLINLVSNSIKFTSVGGVQLRVSCKTRSANEVHLHFEVEDSGIGIPKASLSKMFLAFSQVDSSTTRRFGGTGLGLSICKKLVSLMGGEIGVRSDEGHGSTFWFTTSHDIVTTEEIHELKSQKNLVVETSFNARILVAEDNPINQVVMLRMLKRLGYQPHAVGNGQEVLDALREMEFHLVLMDCQMPEMDGFEASEIIRKSETVGYKNIPIIAVTANAVKDDLEKCLVSGMDDYVTKPVDEGELHVKIEKWLKKSSV